MFPSLRRGARLPILAAVLALGVWAVPGSPAFAHGHGYGGHRGGWHGGYHHGGYYRGGNGYRFGGAYPSGYRGYGYGNGYMYPNYNSGYMYPNNGYVAPNFGYGNPQGFAPGVVAPGMMPGPGGCPGIDEQVARVHSGSPAEPSGEHDPGPSNGLNPHGLTDRRRAG